MQTPICDFVKQYQKEETTRFHMPGHKGHVFFGCEPFDITEIKGADVLHFGNGIIAQSEKNAAKLFGSGETHYSTEGSSQCIKAMLGILQMERKSQRKQQEKERNYILAARNVHRSMIDACALLDLDVQFLYSEESDSICTGKITPEMVMDFLKQTKKKPLGIYVTSPDYLGQITDISGLSSICRKMDIPLLVDNAHGAYLHFIDCPKHPLDLDVTMCCDSAHKTLPVLTGGAYLHINKKDVQRFGSYAGQAMTLFGSTSPSYLIMQSLDLCNAYIEKDYKSRLQIIIEKICQCKEILQENGIEIKESEPLKIVIETWKSGYTGEEIAEELRKYKIECEYADCYYVVLMVTPENTVVDFERLILWSQKSILKNKKKEKQEEDKSKKHRITQMLSIREATFAPSEIVDAKNAVGRICASETISCPPAIPIAISGEIITKDMVEEFDKYGIRSVCVVKETFYEGNNL